MEEQDLKELLKFSEEFREKKKVEENKLPYHINIIDELHINENAHSRILLKFLMYQNTKGEYEIFQSLLDYIQHNNKKKNTFNNIKIENPILTQEKARIDMWIRDNKRYAIIFENKARNAKDQDSQLFRYIEQNRKEGYNEENIYVIYMPQSYKEPEDQSWGSYKEKFAERYFNMPFKEHILPWLKKEVIPNVRQKDVFLSSALLQYVDYLEYFIFKINEDQEKMNVVLNKMIEDHYSLQNEEEKIVELLNDKDNVYSVFEQMEQLCNSYFEKLYNNWRNKTNEKYSNDTNLKIISSNGIWPITGVEFTKLNIKVTISGGYTEPYKNFYSGVDVINNIPEENRKELEEILDQKTQDNQGAFKCYSLLDYKEVYAFFEELINKCIDIASKNN